MKLVEKEPFRYQISVYVSFTAEDLRLVKTCSELHYDNTCKTFFKPGNKGNGLRNRFWSKDYDHVDPFDETCPADQTCGDLTSCTFRDLDTMAKILESYRYLEPEEGAKAMMLGGRIRQILEAINAEATRLMDEQKEKSA